MVASSVNHIDIQLRSLGVEIGNFNIKVNVLCIMNICSTIIDDL